MPEDQITKEQVKEFIKGMTVLELSEMIKELEEELGVKALAAPAVAAEAPAEAAPPKEEKKEFDLILVKAGENRIQTIKVVREITGLGLKEAKDVIDSLPKKLRESIPKEEAEQQKKKLEDVGAKVEIK